MWARRLATVSIWRVRNTDFAHKHKTQPGDGQYIWRVRNTDFGYSEFLPTNMASGNYLLCADDGTWFTLVVIISIFT